MGTDGVVQLDGTKVMELMEPDNEQLAEGYKKLEGHFKGSQLDNAPTAFVMQAANGELKFDGHRTITYNEETNKWEDEDGNQVWFKTDGTDVWLVDANKNPIEDAAVTPNGSSSSINWVNEYDDRAMFRWHFKLADTKPST